MSQLSIGTATRAQAETVIRWLRDEHVSEFGGVSGFYNNRSIIRRAARDSEMIVLLRSRAIIGFAVSRPNNIDIFEIRPTYQRRGHGRFFAEKLIGNLFSSGSTKLSVDCVPHESQHFWRSLGFIDKEEKYQQWDKVLLVLHRPTTLGLQN